MKNQNNLNLAIVGLILFVLACACPKTDERQQSRQVGGNTPNDVTAPQKPEQNGMSVYQTGETVQVENLGYQVKESYFTKTLSKNQYTNQPPDAMYLFVQVAVANGNKEAYTIPQLKLVDEQNAEYDSTSKAFAVEGALGMMDQLNPGVAKAGYVIFDVPAGKKYKLKISGGMWSAKYALIELSPTNKK